MATHRSRRLSWPPPAPAGVNPQAWTSGRWQFNPMFRGPVPGPQPGVPAWAPHPSWGPHAAANNFNPYKRQPNQGNQDYWSTKLSDNPLGLENMHIRDAVSKKTRENGVMHTPWVWVPKELSESPEHQDSTDLPSGREGRDGADGREGRANSRVQDERPATREPSRSRHERSAPTAEAQPRYSQDRYGATYGSKKTDGPSAEPNVIPPPPPNMHNAYPAYSTQRSRDVSPRPADTQQARPEPRSSPNPPTSSASSAAAAAAARSATEAFSSRQELHPTFSPSIVRTPGHYSATSTPVPTRRSTTDDSHATSAHARRSSGDPSVHGDEAHNSSTTPSRRSTHEDASRSSSRAPHGPIYAPARSNSLSKRRSSAPTPSSGSPSSAAAPLPFLASFSEEPEGLLSPLMTAPGGGRELGRSSTFPSLSASSTFDSIPEERAVSQPRTPKPSDRSRYSDPQSTPHVNARSPPRSSHASPESGPQRISRSPSHAQMSPPSQPTRSPNPPTARSPTAQPRSPTQPSHSRSQSASREHSRSRAAHNPLPRPPMPTNYPTVSSASAYSSASTAQPAASYTSSSQPARTSSAYPSGTQPASTRSSNTQPSSHYSSPPRSSSAYASHKPSASYSSSAHTSSAYNSASTAHAASAYPPAPAAPSPGHSPGTRKVRKGYWNRRGDHLVYDQNRDMANPPELAHHPSPIDGFMDHHGQKVKYDPNVPELPESLPLHGEPPKRPYKEVCIFRN
ncbi:uncharacterized protein B0H18DRAFT_982749 [Fomitopsis serialis]|uniref:uncharacterized protein n=1 Tax=Fomitopsis serialis TaxID=139415 RepID=UPI002007D440|nr:uncharacterized protein B0H18DRAFT_982749 [Neoantrodia serialis]KAH9933915.1 hypothetical protein B0H18DRAFT_982749 [Neoantrodia serialis]